MKKIMITERLYFREFCQDDMYNLYKLENNDMVTRYIPGSKKISLWESGKRIKKYIESYEHGNLGIWPVIVKTDESFAGITGFRYLPEIKKTEIGIKLFPEYWGQGYATETGKALIEYGFKELALKEIIAMAIPDNLKSVQSLKNIGMKYYKDGYYKGSRVVYYFAAR